MGLTLTQPLPAAARGVGAVGGLDDDPLVPGGDEVGEERLGRLGVAGEQPRARRGAARASTRASCRTRAGSSMRSTPSRCSTSKRNGRERHPLAQARDVGRARRARPGDLERRRPPVVEQHDGLAVEHEVATGQRGDGLDHLGHALGDLVEAAGVDGDLARSGGAPAPGCRRACRRRAGRHRRRPATASPAVFAEAASIGRTGRPTTSPTCSSASTPPGGGERGHLGGGAGEHGGATHDGVGHGVRLRDGGEHHAVEGALPQVAGDQVDEEALLVGGRAAHQGRPARPGGMPWSRLPRWPPAG